MKFYIGLENSRSQVAMSRVGVKKVAKEEVASFGEKLKLNPVYQIDKKNWKTQKP